MPKLNDKTEVIKINARTAGGLVDTPAMRLESTAIDVIKPMITSIIAKVTIPQ